MNKKEKTKKELLEELTALRQELEIVKSSQTEMKKDQEAQREKGDFFFNIFSAIQEGISVLDGELNILFINPTIERWIPHDLPLVGRKCYEAYHGRSQRCEVCPCYQTLQTGRIANEIIPVLDTTGEISGWSHHFSYPLLDSQTGRMIGVIEYIRNITEQKQTKEALTVSEEKQRSILENLADGYFEVDLTGNLTFFNEALEKIFDYSRDELMGMNNRFYSDEENAQKIYQVFNRVYRTGEPAKGIRFETIEKNKSIKNLELSISLARNDSGNPIGFRGFARDITDLIQIQNELRKSEERYRTIIETMEDAYFEVDLTGNFTFFNKAMFRIMGYPTDKMMGTNFQQYTDTENAQKLFESFNRVYQTGEPIRNIQYSATNKNGVMKNIITSVSLIRDSSGKPVGFRGISKDITDLIQIQTTLRESEERYRTIIETMEEGYYENDLAGNLTFVNEAMAKVLGYSRAEMQGMDYRQYIDAENSKIVYQAFNQVYRTGNPAKGIQYEVVTRSGEKRIVETSPSLIRNQAGNPVGFRGTSRDITTLMHSHKALQESEGRYRTIIETIEDGYFEVDLKGSFTYFNDTMVRIHEYPRVELAEMNNRQYTDAENAKILYQAFNRVYRTGEPSKGTHYEIITKSGVRKNLESSVSLIRDSRGNPVGFRGITRDITELKKAQEALKASEERYRTIIETIEDGYYERN